MSFSFLSRKTRFAHALEAYGLENCSLSPKTHALLVGLKARKDYPFLPLVEIPKAPRFISFFEAPIQAELIGELMRSPEAKTLEHLFIGSSHDWPGTSGPHDPNEAFNMTAAVSALAGGRLPALTELTLGDMEMLFNGQRLTGTLGDVAPVFEAAPNLRQLSLTGSYTLSRPVRHERLETLSAEQSDIGCWSDPPDQATITYLFSSILPRLTRLSLRIDDWEEVAFDLPETFFSDDGFPGLVQIDFNKPKEKAAAHLKEWAARRGAIWRP